MGIAQEPEHLTLVLQDLLRVTRLGTGSVNKDRRDAEDEDDASAVDASEVVDWKPAGFKTDTATGAVQKEEKAARGPNDYRAFTVVCKVAKRPPIDLVVRPYETIDVIKRSLTYLCCVLTHLCCLSEDS